MTQALRARPRRTLLVVPTVADLPASTDNPMLWYVGTSPSFQLWITDSDGKRQLGWSALAEAAADLTLTTSNQDVAGCSVTLPAPGTYIVRAVFDFQLSAAGAFATGTLSAVGVLTDSSDTEVDTPRAALAEWEDPIGVISNDGMVRATVTQMWRVTTTTSDEVFKLRARRSNPGASVTLKAMSPHTTIMASGFLGGDETATTHAHPHSATTGRGTDDHHTEAHDLLGAAHPDTVPRTPVKGDMVFANGTPEWDTRPIGNQGDVYFVAGGVPNWASLSLLAPGVDHDLLASLTASNHHAKYLDSEARTAVPYLATITFGWDPQSPQIFAP